MTSSEYEFFATATDGNGVRSTHRLTAKSAGEAVAQLEDQRYTEIELHTDDAGAAATGMQEVDCGSVTPEEMVQLRSISTVGYFLFLLKKQLPVLGIPLAVSVVFIIWTVVQGNSYGFLFWVAIALILAPLFVAFHFTFFSQTRQYDQLIDAWAWGRWKTVLRLAPKLRGHVPEFELDGRESIALAKLGRIGDGLAMLKLHATNRDVPRWMYLGRLAEFYEFIEQHERAIECHRQAYEFAPENPTVELDYAMSMLTNETNAELAEQLIVSAEDKALSDVLQMILPYIHGLMQLNNRKYSEAKAFFLEAKANLEPLSASQPLIRLILDTNDAYLAIACANSGDRDSATKIASSARKRLEALGSQRLLSRLEKAVDDTQRR